jgi:large subunit ribosomal protein L21
MSYAIISVGGKQYRVREGERLLVDRIDADEGKSFSPDVLLLGGEGEPQLAPKGVTVTARVVAQRRGPKLRIGKYRRRTGYKRHLGFRAALTQIEIESIGSGSGRRASTSKATAAKPAPSERRTAKAASAVPDGYSEMTVSDVKSASDSWDRAALAAALDYERAHGQRKGAIAVLEAALSAHDEES